MVRRSDGLAAQLLPTFNTASSGFEEADALLIIGSNPRVEAP
jgi:hypothetical protein